MHFAEETPHLRPLPPMPFNTVLGMERRVTRDGMVSVAVNFYSVPDCTRRQVVEVQTLAEDIRFLEGDKLIAAHPVLEGRGQRRIAAGHRVLPPPANSATPRAGQPVLRPKGEIVTPRDLAIDEAIGRRLATQEIVR